MVATKKISCRQTVTPRRRSDELASPAVSGPEGTSTGSLAWMDIMFGHAKDETYSLTTSIGKDSNDKTITRTVTSGDCNQKARLDQRSCETYVKETGSDRFER